MISETELINLVIGLILNLCKACLPLEEQSGNESKQGNLHVSKRQRKLRIPLDISDRNARWLTKSESSIPTSTNIRQKDILQKLQNIFPSNRQVSVFEGLFSFPKQTLNGYRKTAQFVAVISSILSAKKLNQTTRLRSIYYNNVILFDRNQGGVNECVDVLCEYFGGIHMSELNILPSAKGLYAGPIRCHFKEGEMFEQDDFSISETRSEQLNFSPALIQDTSSIASIELLQQIKWILIVEKDAAFAERVQELNNLVDIEGFDFFTSGVIITGKGFPDYATTRFISMVHEQLPEKTPIILLTDGDAYGVHIANTYESRLENLLENIYWVGLKPSQWQQGMYQFNPANCIPLNVSERQRAFQLLNRSDVGDEKKWEISKLLKMGFKLELESIKNKSLSEILLSFK